MKISCITLVLMYTCLLIAAAQTLPDDQDLRIILMSDLNESYGSTHYGQFVDNTMAYVNEWQPDLVLFAGDMIDGQSLKLSETDIRAM